MQKIVPHLWYDREARQAAELYVSVFPDSRIKSVVELHGTPSGSAEIVSFELLGQEFQAISAGPEFKLNPSVSFQVICKTKAQVDAIWQKLSESGEVLMELGAYPFSERFGWLADRFGLSWQVLYSAEAGVQAKIIPFVLFVGEVCGRAEEAINFWTSVFPGSKVHGLDHHSPGEAPDLPGTLRQGSFSLAGQAFGAMDSAHDHRFAFNEAISFIVNCESQDEIDDYWNKLSAVPEAEVCGWLKDRFGFSWQITPVELETMLASGDRAAVDRVTQAFLPMKKLDLAALRRAYAGT